MFKLFEVRKAQSANILNLIVAIVLIIAAAIPVTLDVITDSAGTPNISGTTRTIVNLIPLFLGIGALIVVARSVIGGT